MAPTLADGDEVEVHLCAGAETRVGDVVLVLQGRSTILHRVIERRAAGLVTQGDGVRWPDDLVPFERVLGVAALPRRPFFARVLSVRARLARWKRALASYSKAA